MKNSMALHYVEDEIKPKAYTPEAFEIHPQTVLFSPCSPSECPSFRLPQTATTLFPVHLLPLLLCHLSSEIYFHLQLSKPT